MEIAQLANFASDPRAATKSAIAEINRRFAIHRATPNADATASRTGTIAFAH
jgi:hypothetical protein